MVMTITARTAIEAIQPMMRSIYSFSHSSWEAGCCTSLCVFVR